jgi:hypothetical protein
VTFIECVAFCAGNPEFVSQWARLRGFKLSGLSPLEQEIDKASGFGEHVAKTFIADVADLVWDRMPRGEEVTCDRKSRKDE